MKITEAYLFPVLNNRTYKLPLISLSIFKSTIYTADKGVLFTRLKSRSRTAHTLLPVQQGSVSQTPCIFLEGAA